MRVDCYTTGSDGTCDTAVPATPFFSTKTFEFDHTPSITAVNAVNQTPGEVVGGFQYDAVSAWTDNGLFVEPGCPGGWQGRMHRSYSAPCGVDGSKIVYHY
jgi:hypothetical protein